LGEDINACLTLDVFYDAQEKRQERVKRWRLSSLQILQCLLTTPQGLTTAFLSIEPEGKGNGETRDREKAKRGSGIIFFFALDLENFGQTRIDARIGQSRCGRLSTLISLNLWRLLQRELPDFQLLYNRSAMQIFH